MVQKVIGANTCVRVTSHTVLDRAQAEAQDKEDVTSTDTTTRGGHGCPLGVP